MKFMQTSFRVRLNSETRTITGSWVYPDGTELECWKSVDGEDGTYGIDGQIDSLLPPDILRGSKVVVSADGSIEFSSG